MKGPSLEAIRKFKEQQEKKKVQDEERRIQEKLSTLNHRAAQGDKKAKSSLIKIEKIEKEKSLVDNLAKSQHVNRSSKSGSSSQTKQNGNKPNKGTTISKPKVSEFNFEDLMKMAKQNTNQMVKPTPQVAAIQETVPEVAVFKKSKEPLERRKVQVVERRINERERLPPPVHRQAPHVERTAKSVPIHRGPQVERIVKSTPIKTDRIVNQRSLVANKNIVHNAPSNRMIIQSSGSSSSSQYQQNRIITNRPRIVHRPREDDYDDDDYDDLDDFVVEDEEDEVDEQEEELRRTLKSVFRYDKRRCDRREEELDRQYRAIGRVSTFEDLEREERRASRLAAMEDAEAQREEEDRKRKKALKFKSYR